MSMVQRHHVMGERFHPTDVELINYLERFLKGEPVWTVCPIQSGELYGDQPPSQIFGADYQEKFRYFFTPLKKHKEKHTRFIRSCANGTWKAQSGEPIKSKGTVVGFKRSFIYMNNQEPTQNKAWLMKEYSVRDDFFRENNISKQEYFVVCRIKKNTKAQPVVVNDILEEDVKDIVDDLLYGPDRDCTGVLQPATTCQLAQQVMNKNQHQFNINGVQEQATTEVLDTYCHDIINEVEDIVPEAYGQPFMNTGIEQVGHTTLRQRTHTSEFSDAIHGVEDDVLQEAYAQPFTTGIEQVGPGAVHQYTHNSEYMEAIKVVEDIVLEVAYGEPFMEDICAPDDWVEEVMGWNTDETIEPVDLHNQQTGPERYILE